MAQTPRDITFERAGKPLKRWLLDLISLEPELRQEAGEAIAAMYFGVPSVRTEFEDLDSDGPDGESEQAAWQAAVAHAVNAPGFPRRSFFIGAATRLVGAQEKYISELAKGDEQYERICERLAERLDATTDEEQRQNHLRRLGRTICASIARDCEEDLEVPEALSFASMMLTCVMPAAATA